MTDDSCPCSEEEAAAIVAAESPIYAKESVRFIQRAAADAQLLVDHGRIIKHNVLSARGRTVFADFLHGLSDHFLGKLPGIPDRCGTADKGRIRAVKGADSFQASLNVCKV